jgi:hypothetical protein
MYINHESSPLGHFGSDAEDSAALIEADFASSFRTIEKVAAANHRDVISLRGSLMSQASGSLNLQQLNDIQAHTLADVIERTADIETDLITLVDSLTMARSSISDDLEAALQTQQERLKFILHLWLKRTKVVSMKRKALTQAIMGVSSSPLVIDTTSSSKLTTQQALQNSVFSSAIHRKKRKWSDLVASTETIVVPKSSDFRGLAPASLLSWKSLDLVRIVVPLLSSNGVTNAFFKLILLVNGNGNAVEQWIAAKFAPKGSEASFYSAESSSAVNENESHDEEMKKNDILPAAKRLRPQTLLHPSALQVTMTPQHKLTMTTRRIKDKSNISYLSTFRGVNVSVCITTITSNLLLRASGHSSVSSPTKSANSKDVLSTSLSGAQCAMFICHVGVKSTMQSSNGQSNIVLFADWQLERGRLGSALIPLSPDGKIALAVDVILSTSSLLPSSPSMTAQPVFDEIGSVSDVGIVKKIAELIANRLNLSSLPEAVINACAVHVLNESVLVDIGVPVSNLSNVGEQTTFGPSGVSSVAISSSLAWLAKSIEQQPPRSSFSLLPTLINNLAAVSVAAALQGSHILSPAEVLVLVDAGLNAASSSLTSLKQSVSRYPPRGCASIPGFNAFERDESFASAEGSPLVLRRKSAAIAVQAAISSTRLPLKSLLADLAVLNESHASSDESPSGTLSFTIERAYHIANALMQAHRMSLPLSNEQPRLNRSKRFLSSDYIGPGSLKGAGQNDNEVLWPFTKKCIIAIPKGGTTRYEQRLSFLGSKIDDALRTWARSCVVHLFNVLRGQHNQLPSEPDLLLPRFQWIELILYIFSERASMASTPFSILMSSSTILSQSDLDENVDDDVDGHEGKFGQHKNLVDALSDAVDLVETSASYLSSEVEAVVSLILPDWCKDLALMNVEQSTRSLLTEGFSNDNEAVWKHQTFYSAHTASQLSASIKLVLSRDEVQSTLSKASLR